MTTLEDKHNFDLGYEKGCQETKEQYQQKIQDIIKGMQCIPDEILPIGKTAWSMEWKRVIEKLKLLLEKLDGRVPCKARSKGGT